MKTYLTLLCCLAAFAPLFAQDSGITISATGKGVEVLSDAGKFLLAPSALRLSETDYSSKKPLIEWDGGDTIVAKFECGAELRMEVMPADRKVACSFTGVPAGAWGFVVQMEIPMAVARGGKFSFGTDALQPFPDEKGKQIVADRTAKQFNLAGPAGPGFSVMATQSYAQLQDNRAFNWAVFMYLYNFPISMHPGKTGFEFQFEPLDPSLTP